MVASGLSDAMNYKKFYAQRLGLLFVGCIALFALLLALFTDLGTGTYWTVIGVAVVSMLAVAATVFMMPFGIKYGEESVAPILSRITAGDLTLTRSDYATAAASEKLTAALRALVLNLERTITRFSQLVADVSTAGEQISRQSRSLARSADNQLASAEATTASMGQIDQSIKSVQKSMENLSLNAEETSTSILEMSASIEEVARIGETLSEFVEQTASAIEEMIASINEVAMNTESFSSFSIQTASSMVQMNATTQEIGRSARQSSDLARYVLDAVNEGLETVLATVEGMRNIAQAVDEAKEAITQLGDRSHEIGEIVRVIDEIAGQTNLLALNAAIIAAQAGDRGKGFAVVADEIRDLSERTSVSTEEIRTLIQNVQRGVGRAGNQMSASGERVNDGLALATRAEQVLGKIRDLTERSTESIGEIAKATEEQTRGSDAATRAIEEVTKMVQQTATATQQQSVTSRKIGEQASVVRDYMKHLKRAMSEQESGSRAIGRAMENIMTAVSTVLESTNVLGNESASILNSMSVIEQSSRESNFAVSDLNQMANTLRHESSLLHEEMQRFTLPTAMKGGLIRTASVLPHVLNLDPIHAQFIALSYMQKSIHENLVQFGEGAEIVPALAERWEILDHGRLYRFHIRPTARFHNGRSVRATDIRDNFLRMGSPKENSGARWIVRPIVGMEAVVDGEATAAEGLVVRDDLTIDVVLEEPLAFFLLLMTMPETAIVPVEEARDPEHFRLNAVGAGAFTVAETNEGKNVRLRRNPNYYDPERPHVDEIDFRLDFKSARESTEAFFRGELDIVHGVPLPIVREVRENPEYAPYLLSTIQLHTSYLAWDCSRPPFDKVEVRQAMWHAINRERINEHVYSGLGFVASSFLPPGLLGYDPNLRKVAYDPDRARDLLRRAGYGSGFATEYWRWDTDEFYNSGIVPMIVEDLAQVGIDVKVSLHSAVDVREAHSRTGHGTIYAGNWYADFPDSDNFFYIFFHSQSETHGGIGYHSSELDQIIDEGRRTNDLERRGEIYRGLNERMHTEAPIHFLFHDRLFVLYRPEIRGVRTYLAPPPVRYHDVWIER
jgi:methyl-accepting chemotaxis protein/ABC-type transport system substrate-binding protein